MAHKIELPHDQVFSTVSREWHGLANLVESIDRETISPILFPIVEGDLTVSLDGESVKLEDKAIVADYRFRSDLDGHAKIKPLSVMGKDYRVITNQEIFDAVMAAIETENLDAKIVTAGTLRGGKSFFISLNQDNQNGIDMTGTGDKWDFHINLLTSHDGVDCLNAYLCGFRTVCWNTARWGCDSADVKAKIYHTKNASLQLKSLPELLQAMKNKQEDLCQKIVYLSGIDISLEKAEQILKGYYFNQVPDNDIKLSTRTSNNIKGVLDLFQRGQGNNGKSLYDLMNGFTEYYTSGEGTGKGIKTTQADRKFRSEVGGAADHKEQFINLLMDSNMRNELLEAGEKVVLAG